MLVQIRHLFLAFAQEQRQRLRPLLQQLPQERPGEAAKAHPSNGLHAYRLLSVFPDDEKIPGAPETQDLGAAVGQGSDQLHQAGDEIQELSRRPARTVDRLPILQKDFLAALKVFGATAFPAEAHSFDGTVEAICGLCRVFF
jgi:hypothetical protein